MAQLIQMRQRIKAIETIKKITHAMRLISMSNHARLKHQEEPLNTYLDALRSLFYTIKAQTPAWENSIFYPTNKIPKHLIILVGSQKGLCGTFNHNVFKLFEESITPSAHNQFIAIGKKAVDYLHDYLASHPGTLVNTYSNFSPNSAFSIAQLLTNEIVAAGKEYTQVTCIGNKATSFFFQKAYQTHLIPFSATDTSSSSSATAQEYLWEQSPQELLDMLAFQYIEATLQTILFQSALAEQAARFLSMDSSTRNAENLLETTELLYNKMRQAKITKELTELTGSF